VREGRKGKRKGEGDDPAAMTKNRKKKSIIEAARLLFCTGKKKKGEMRDA